MTKESCHMTKFDTCRENNVSAINKLDCNFGKYSTKFE